MLTKDFGHISVMENDQRGLSTEATNHFPNSASAPPMQQGTVGEALMLPIRIKE